MLHRLITEARQRLQQLEAWADEVAGDDDGTGCSRHCDHAAAVPAVCRVLGAFGSVPRQSGGHSSCMQILVRTVRTVQQTVEISQLQFWGWFWTCLLWCNQQVPWLGSRNAWFDDGYMLCIIQGGFWKNFMIFYVKEYSDPELDSRPALLAGTSSTTAVACSILVLLV